ncbi:hypothetical protein AK812_SmicGene531 [Symbiodinium microadriaticum]|uniref:Uncharacterized protein n=1 Tax=Symbiodinium microadriaticum TaxID=2951 RepID=A0A1Q9F6H7_SYMMI|nr:hypothetical protein AK812_SmicGene531 [Symbiodinium microadriaticum]
MVQAALTSFAMKQFTRTLPHVAVEIEQNYAITTKWLSWVEVAEEAAEVELVQQDESPVELLEQESPVALAEQESPVVGLEA